MRGGDGSDPPSLEYIEDSYLPKIDQPTFTPSLDEITEYGLCGDLDLSNYCNNADECHWSEEQEYYLRSLTLDQLLSLPASETLSLPHYPPLDEEEELQQIETEFSPMNPQMDTTSSCNSKSPFKLSRRLKFFTRKAMREVRVTFVDLSKPYLAKMSSGDNYRKFLETGNNGYVIGN
jgi:hypothetical protein